MFLFYFEILILYLKEFNSYNIVGCLPIILIMILPIDFLF